MPSGLTLASMVSVFCNYAIIRMKGRIILKLALFNFSAVVLVMLNILYYINSKLFELRSEALNLRKREAGATKLVRRVLNGCRVYRMVFGSFYNIDYMFMMISFTMIINYTVTLLIVFN